MPEARAIAELPSAMNPMSMPTFFCPFPPALNPNVRVVDRRTTRWLRAQALLTTPREVASWSSAMYGWLPSRCHPGGSVEAVALAADWYAWLFMFDDLGDRADIGDSPAELLRRGDRFLEILSGLPHPSALAADPLERALAVWARRLLAWPGADVWLPRFLDTARTYFAALAWEATNRAAGVVPSVEEYLRMRLDTGAVKTCFSTGELVEGIFLPEEVWRRPEVEALATMANRIVCFENDVVSTAKEREIGEVHNYVILLQCHQGLSRRQAIDAVIEHHDREMRRFVAACAELPDLGDPDHDATVRRYAAMLGRWIRANLDWSFECGRYRAGVDSLASA